MASPVIRPNEPTCEVTFENLLQFPEGEKVLTCMQCGVCGGTCPYGDVMDYPPRRVIGMLRAGLLERVFASDRHGPDWQCSALGPSINCTKMILRGRPELLLIPSGCSKPLPWRESWVFRLRRR